MARIGIEELEGRKYVRTTSFEYLFSYEKKLLLVSVLWNLKHSIELILKTLNVRLNRHFLKSHDITKLALSFEKSIQDSSWEIKKREKIRGLAYLALKYRHLKFWQSKLIATGTVEDVKNDLFRYPDSSLRFELPLKELATITPQNLRELKSDIGKLEQLFGILFHQIREAKF